MINAVIEQMDMFMTTEVHFSSDGPLELQNFKQEYRNQFIVSNDDYGYFPASRDGKEGYDIRLRGAQWQSDPILDNKMPDRFPDFENVVTEYINSVAALGKILLR